MPHSYPLDAPPRRVPATMTRAFRVEALDEEGEWEVIARVEDNYQRLVRVRIDVETDALRFIPEATWGADTVHLFALDVR
jgi:hypothetical protein